MKKLVTSVVAAIALSATSAFAADMPVKAPRRRARTGAIAVRHRLRRVAHERLQFPRRLAVQPWAVGGRLCRAAVQYRSIGTLYVGLAGYSIDWPSARAMASPIRRLKSTSTAAGATRGARSASTSASSITTTRTSGLRRRPDSDFFEAVRQGVVRHHSGLHGRRQRSPIRRTC